MEFLGVLLNSWDITATLPSRKKEHIKEQSLLLLKKDTTLHDLASFIGLTVASDPAVELAPLRYKYLEIIRNRELALNLGDYNARITLDAHARDFFFWVDSQYHLSI